MAEKLPVIMDNRADNTVVNALRRLLPNLQKIDVAGGVFDVGSFCPVERPWHFTYDAKSTTNLSLME